MAESFLYLPPHHPKQWPQLEGEAAGGASGLVPGPLAEFRRFPLLGGACTIDAGNTVQLCLCETAGRVRPSCLRFVAGVQVGTTARLRLRIEVS